jgi:hypothetical protein
VVAALRGCGFNAFSTRVRRREDTQIFIPRGTAAILAICSLEAVFFRDSILFLSN